MGCSATKKKKDYYLPTNIKIIKNLLKIFHVRQRIAFCCAEHGMECFRSCMNKFTNITRDEPREKYEVHLSD